MTSEPFLLRANGSSSFECAWYALASTTLSKHRGKAIVVDSLTANLEHSAHSSVQFVSVVTDVEGPPEDCCQHKKNWRRRWHAETVSVAPDTH